MTQQTVRQPLTRKQILEILGDVFDSDDETFIGFARTIEAAHGIAAQPTIKESLTVAPIAQPERNFCARCGKRLAGDGIHTCSPPKDKP